ncbi:zinc-binding domain-containing protein [Hypoxylon rubiginosum]|uniref:Zinc-binding domain-containing protein n=1 Tax=Hypoxylon rubiginosum TaxID=110542 RepID=A0ACC0CJI3_9PEZI|nr:zinc-binding domain-containing protein [Hypoxylon rubiginosum]
MDFLYNYQTDRSSRRDRNTFPSLHHDVSNAVSSDISRTWYNQKRGGRADDEYQPHVKGTFKCDSDGCAKHGWSSKKVAILIRRYHGNGYNADVFNQRYRSCSKLGTFTLDEASYIDRVAYRLKKWAGVKMEVKDYNRGEGPPHETKLCEGCKAGYCQEGVIFGRTMYNVYGRKWTSG